MISSLYYPTIYYPTNLLIYGIFTQKLRRHYCFR